MTGEQGCRQAGKGVGRQARCGHQADYKQEMAQTKKGGSKSMGKQGRVQDAGKTGEVQVVKKQIAG